MEIGRLLGTITLHFRDGTKKKSQSLYHLANRYFEKWGVQMRKPSKKEGEKHKTLTLKQALREVSLMDAWDVVYMCSFIMYMFICSPS